VRGTPMTERVHRKGIAWLWLVSLVVFLLGIAGLFTINSHQRRPFAAKTPAMSSGPTAHAPADQPAQPSAPGKPTARPISTGASGVAAKKAVPVAAATRPAPSRATGPAAASPMTPVCASNTSLQQSPDRHYTYPRTGGGRPVAWPDA